MSQPGRGFVPYYVDFGTGESDFTWQAMAGIDDSCKHWDVVAAWRHLDNDMGSGRPLSELSRNGPQWAVAYRW